MTIASQLRRRLGFSRTSQVLSAVICSSLSLAAAAEATAIYDAFLSLSVAAGPNIPPGASLFLFPGATVTPPPFFEGFVSNGDPAFATRAADASVPGQVSASVFGIGSTAKSSASAFGFGSLLNEQAVNVKFPLVVTEDWSLSTGWCCGDIAHATIRGRVVFDELEVFGILRKQGGSNHASTLLMLELRPGFNGLLFSADVAGSATPEPASLLLFGSSLAGIGLAGWRRLRSKQQSPAVTS